MAIDSVATGRIPSLFCAALEKVHFQVNRHWMDFVTDPVLVSASFVGLGHGQSV